MCNESPNSIRDWSRGSAKTFNPNQMMFWIAENCPLWSFWYAWTHAFESVSTFSVSVLSHTASFKLFRIKEVKYEWLPQKSLETPQFLQPIVAIFPSKMQEIHWYQNITPQSESRGRCYLHSDLALDIGYMPQQMDLPCIFLQHIEYGQLFYHHRTTRLNSYKPCRNGTPLAYIGNALFYIRHANHFQHLWSVLQPITCCWTILRKVFCGSTEVRSRRYPGHGSSLQPKWMRSESMKHRQKGDPCQQETYTLMGRVNRHLALCEITTSCDQRAMGLGIAMTIYCNLDVKISCCRFIAKLNTQQHHQTQFPYDKLAVPP